MSDAPYFANHARRRRFPWSLYHRGLERRVARAVRELGPGPRVLVVGCGLEPEVPGGPAEAIYYGCDVDPRAIEACRARDPAASARLAVCPAPYALPEDEGFPRAFDAVVAKEVVEHTDDPARWARVLAGRVAAGGALILTTPNYGRSSTLALLERTVLEWIARRDGYTRRHIHPSKFDKKTLAALDVGAGMRLDRVEVARTGWTLVGVWRRPTR